MKFWQVLKEVVQDGKSIISIDSSWKSLEDAEKRVEQIKEQFQKKFYYYPNIQWEEQIVKYYDSSCIRHTTVEDVTKDFDPISIEIHEKLLV